MSEHETLFKYVTRQGETVFGDNYPMNDVLELILVRNTARFMKDGIRAHLSHPLHEAAMSNLPNDLIVLRMDDTKVREFPRVPPTLEELYAEYNYFINIPDLAYATNLHIMNLGNGRIEHFIGALPPNIQSIDLQHNTFKSFNKQPGPTVNVRLFGNPESRIYNFHAMPITREEAMGGGQNVQYNPGIPEIPPAAIIAEPAIIAAHHNAALRPIQDDTQNVHDHAVQNSTDKNISYLVERRKDIQYDENFLTRVNKRLTQYRREKSSFLMRILRSVVSITTINPEILYLQGRFGTYAMHGVTFQNLVESVWLRIEAETITERQNELIRRFCEEIHDGQHFCTGGMMVRLCNVFIGFDENINITLNPTVVLQGRIPATMKRIRTEMEIAETVADDALPFDYWIKCLIATEHDMKELAVERSQWSAWLVPLFEPIQEEIKKRVFDTCGQYAIIEERAKVTTLIGALGIDPEFYILYL